MSHSFPLALFSNLVGGRGRGRERVRGIFGFLLSRGGRWSRGERKRRREKERGRKEKRRRSFSILLIRREKGREGGEEGGWAVKVYSS